MKHILKMIGNWILLGIWIFIVLGISYLSIKARQTTNPWLTDLQPDSLYVTNNETLSAAKRNTLVDKIDVIYCSKTWTLSTTSAWSQSYTFTASDCWWELPDSNYVATVWDIQAEWTYIYAFKTNLYIQNSIRFYHASWANWTYRVSVIYIKK